MSLPSSAHRPLPADRSPVDLPLLVPIGQPLGYEHTPDGLVHDRVRVGNDFFRLPPLPSAVWRLLHRTAPDRTHGLDRRALHEYHLPGAEPGMEALLDELADNQVAAEIPLTGPELTEFARTVRLCGLLECLGNTPLAPHLFAFGFPGTAVCAGDAVVRELLAWGPRHRSLYDTAERVATMLRASGVPEELRTPEGLVAALVAGLHSYLEVGAVYLDTALAGPA